MSDCKVRVSRPIISHLEGSSAWQEPDAKLPDGRPYSNADSMRLCEKIKAAKTRKDGSVVVELSRAERDDLRLYVEVQEIGARDGVNGYRMGDREYGEYAGELRACRSLLRQLESLRARELLQGASRVSLINIPTEGLRGLLP